MNFLRKVKNKYSKEDKRFLKFLKPILGYTPNDLHYYKKAFTHSSAKKTFDGKAFNYERLEFLGDAFIDTVVASFLYDAAPLKDEGYLTQMRSKIVSRTNLNTIGKHLNLLEFVESNVSEQKFGDNIFGNIYEAICGAVYLDKGYKTCEKFITKTLISPYVNIERLEGKITSYKSVLIEWCQKHKKEIEYETIEDKTKEKVKHFSVKLIINSKVTSKGRATSKKKAEEVASKRAYYSLQSRIEN
ncbi:MAG: ribonuclease III [Flavobacteriaceae bacterium]